jgi:uncharacterized coiled-coil protein SlyX
MQKLNNRIQELESKILYQDTLNPLVSKSTVGWHIEHSLLTINLVVNAIEKSDPSTYKRRFSFIRMLVMTTKKIPRGKARAPKMVQPNIDFTAETLKEHLEKAKNNIQKLQTIEPNHYFVHPYFGHLKLKATIQFLEIHTHHHLQIINDIINNKT